LDFRLSPENTLPRIFSDGKIDWCFNPISSPEWLWRLNRHQWWNILGKAYACTGDERYAEAFVSQMLDWIDRNPPPGLKNEKSPTWRLMEAGMRMQISWLPSFALFYSSQSFTDSAKLVMLRSINDHARFLFMFKTNRNHLLRESNGLAYTSVYFREFKQANLWLKTALDRIEQELVKQVNLDGSHIEISTGYQWVVIDEFEKTHQLLKTNDLSLPKEDLAGWLEKMYAVLVYSIRPDGTFPEINDGFIRWDHTRLADAGELLGRDDFVHVGTGGEKGTVPAITSTSIPDAGWYIMRSDWTKEARYLLFDAGPYGGPHGHEDKLSIEVYAFGQPFIVDSGSYTYEKTDPFRAYFVGTQGHNSLIVDRKSQIRRWHKENMRPKAVPGKYATWISQSGFDYVSSNYQDGYSTYSLKKPAKPIIIDDVVHTRRVLFAKPDYWILIDEVQASRSHDYQLLFHTPPEILPTICDDRKVVLKSKKMAASLYLIPSNPDTAEVHCLKGSKNPIQGWYSVDHHNKTPSATIIFERNTKSTTVFAILIYPVPSHQARDDIRFDPIEVKGGKGIAFNVITPDGIDYFMFSSNNEIKEFASFHTKEMMAAIRINLQGKILSQFEFSNKS
jgi:hypothetical protein